MRLFRHLSALIAASALALPLTPVAFAAGQEQGEASTVTAQVLTRELVTQEISRALIAQFNIEGDLQLEVISSLPRTQPSSSVWQLQVSEFPTSLAGIMQVRVRFSTAGRETFDFPFNVRAQVWREVFVAREQIAKESLFDASQLDTRRVDVLKERNVVPVSTADNSMCFRTQVAAGRLILFRDLERRALVRKGDMVEVIASDGLITVKMKALAMQNGSAGETITVRNMQSKRDISALVVAENQAQVRF